MFRCKNRMFETVIIQKTAQLFNADFHAAIFNSRDFDIRAKFVIFGIAAIADQDQRQDA